MSQQQLSTLGRKWDRWRARMLDALAHEHRAVWYVADLMEHCRLSSGTAYVLLVRLENEGVVVRRQAANGRYEYLLASRSG